MEGLVGVSWRKDGSRGDTRRSAREGDSRGAICRDQRECLCMVEYDYLQFHLTMHCYLCSLATEALHLNEHEAARWLSKDELDSVKWLPADAKVVELLKSRIQ